MSSARSASVLSVVKPKQTRVTAAVPPLAYLDPTSHDPHGGTSWYTEKTVKENCEKDCETEYRYVCMCENV